MPSGTKTQTSPIELRWECVLWNMKSFSCLLDVRPSPSKKNLSTKNICNNRRKLENCFQENCNLKLIFPESFSIERKFMNRSRLRVVSFLARVFIQQTKRWTQGLELVSERVKCLNTSWAFKRVPCLLLLSFHPIQGPVIVWILLLQHVTLASIQWAF